MAFESLSDKLASVFKKLRGKGKLTEQDIKDAMREVRMALLEADVNYKVAKDFIAGVTQRAMGQEVMESLTPAQQVIKIVNDELTELMGGSEAARIHIKSKPPTVIMMCGLQGAGKTTHTAKLAKHFIKEGHRPLLAACDIYRPAAVDQLKIVGEKAGAPVFALPGEKPEAIAKKAVAHAKDYGNDIVILDTAGRLHVDGDLMAELQRIKENVQVDETLLVIDAMAGQDAVNVAKSFSESTGLDGVILLAFILGFPANEIVVPIIIMAYLSTGSLVEMNDLSALHTLLVQNGWTWVTAVCTMLFSLMHWPCSTTCLTIRKESQSWKWTAAAFALPTAAGLASCALVANGARLVGRLLGG